MIGFYLYQVMYVTRSMSYDIDKLTTMTITMSFQTFTFYLTYTAITD